MPDEPPDRPVTTAARVRFVLGRLLGPWVWALAIFGAVCFVAPGTRYMFPTPGFNCPGPSAEEYFHGGRPAVGLIVGPIARSDRIAAGHWRQVAVAVSGPVRPLHARGEEEIAQLFATGDLPAWSEAWPRWGLAVVSDIEQPFSITAMEPITFRGEEYRFTTLTFGFVWLMGIPALWSTTRFVAGCRYGWGAPAPPGRWRRTLQPFALTFGLMGAALIALGGDEYHHGSEWGEGAGFAFARRDPDNAVHPRFFRLAFDRPMAAVPEPWDGEEPRPPWAFGDRRWGLHADRRLGARYPHHPAMPDPDDPTFEERTALDLSLWYVLLPAALWSGVSLWRSRAGRMRPA